MILGIAGANAQSAQSNELDLFQLDEDIRSFTVTSVSKRAETVGEAPATVTVITKDEFARYGFRNVAEALRTVPGMFLSSGRDYDYTGVRGISLPLDVDTRVLVLLDGHTLNNPWSASSNPGELFTLPPHAIERVEVIRGPASSIYGSNAFFAVVNIVTRRAKDDHQNDGAVELLGGTTRFARASLATQHKLPIGLELSAFATVLGGNGPVVDFGPEMPGSGVTSMTDYERGYNVGGLASYKGLTLQARLASRWKGLPSAPGLSIFNDPYNSLKDEHAFFEARYSLELGSHSAQLRAYVDRFRHRQFLHRDPTNFDPDVVADQWTSYDLHTESVGEDDTLGAELQGTLKLHENDTLTVGVDVQRHVAFQPTYQLNPVTGQYDPDRIYGGEKDANGNLLTIEQLNAAVYLQNELRPFKGLHLVAGLRFDFNSLFTDFSSQSPLAAFAPRAAVVYSLGEGATFKLTYGEAFRNPSVFEAFFDDNASVCSNPDLAQERARTGELAGVFKVASGVNASASVFYTDATDLLIKETVAECYLGSGARTRYVNGGRITSLGAELSLNVKLPSQLQGFAAATVVRSRQSTSAGSQPLPNSPVFVGAAGVAVPLWRDRLTASARMQYVGPRYNWRLTASPVEAGYLKVDAALVAKRLFGGTTAGLTVSNALNTRWRDPVTTSETIPNAIPQNGIEVRLHAGYEW